MRDILEAVAGIVCGVIVCVVVDLLDGLLFSPHNRRPRR